MSGWGGRFTSHAAHWPLLLVYERMTRSSLECCQPLCLCVDRCLHNVGDGRLLSSTSCPSCLTPAWRRRTPRSIAMLHSSAQCSQLHLPTSALSPGPAHSGVLLRANFIETPSSQPPWPSDVCSSPSHTTDRSVSGPPGCLVMSKTSRMAMESPHLPLRFSNGRRPLESADCITSESQQPRMFPSRGLPQNPSNAAVP